MRTTTAGSRLLKPVVVALVAVGLVALGGDRLARAAFPGDNGLIAFTSYRDGDIEVYTMAADGSTEVNRTTNPAGDSKPAWSPDGKRIAFGSSRDGNFEIYTMAPDGSDVVRLTTNAAVDANPAWSPDGTMIAFERRLSSTNIEIYTMAADGSGQVNRTNNPAIDMQPAWSPDGTSIAFTTYRDGNAEVYTMAPDGSGPTNRTANPAFDGHAEWSPDGTRIAFSSLRDGNLEIYTMAPDGSDAVRLTTDPENDSSPAWSPDGKRIAFTAERDGNREIYTMASDGSDAVRLTTDPAEDNWPDWQPVAPAPPPPPPPPPLSPPPAPPVADACPREGAEGYVHPAKMRVLRSRVLRSKRRLDVYAPITSRARGRVQVTYEGDRRRDTFKTKVTSGNAELDRIRFREPITRGQARLGTGIVTLDYKGDADTRPQQVRLRAASRRAELDVDEISLIGDRLSASGRVTRRARGIVRLRFSYLDAAGNPHIHLARATIRGDGGWRLKDDVVPPQLARCGGYLSILFTGYFERRIRGEMLAYQLDAGQTRRP